MPIDVMQAPYNCRFDWTGIDATATDNYAGLQAAINDAKVITPPGVDLGGSIGDLLLLPKGAGLVSQKLVLPFGVYMKGVNCYSTVLKMADNFTPHDHFIDIGDGSTQLAAFNCGLSDMILYSRNRNADYAKAMVYTNNAQDTDPIVGRCRIYAGNRAAIWAEHGYGGASLINFRNITIMNDGNLDGGIVNPVSYFNYGDGTMVRIDGVEPNGPTLGGGAAQIGMYLAGGTFDIRGYHAEAIQTGLLIDLASGSVHIEGATGGNGTANLITIQNRPSQAGRTTVKKAFKNGSTYVVYSGLPGAASVTSDIFAEMTF
jgi:hypothetical protein